MIEITNLRQGAILNHNHGIETGEGLTITVRGISTTGQPVKINGNFAEMDGRNFNASIKLTEKINKVEASVLTPYGNFSQEIVLVWDKKSFRRYHFYIDDHIFLFTEIARERPKHAFEHFYLAGLKKIHDKYGLKLTLNCFYHNDHNNFELKEMPDIWKSEFVDNSDWLRLSFHSYSEFPDRPYLESSAEEFSRDYNMVKNEIIRFAGEETWIPPVVIHWANIHPAVLQELVARGTRAYVSSYRPRIMGGPSLVERQKGGNMAAVENRNRTGDRTLTGTLEGLRAHYLNLEEDSYLTKHQAYYNPAIGIFLFGGSRCCCNLVPKKDIAGRYEKTFEAAKSTGAETFGGSSHEQYTFPFYPNYIPDHFERIEEAARSLTQGGCKPVFFNEGILGNSTWEE
jgi:hypothetical protein